MNPLKFLESFFNDQTDIVIGSVTEVLGETRYRVVFKKKSRVVSSTVNLDIQQGDQVAVQGDIIVSAVRKVPPENRFEL